MAHRDSRTLFVNLAVRDLKKSAEFFTKLGFERDPASLSSEHTACMTVSDRASINLLHESYFRAVTENSPCDTSKQREGVFALTCQSRSAVDTLVDAAFAAGATPALAPKASDAWYSRSFYDLDGHHWELFWLNPTSA
jgi:uncharacterized protein